MSRRQLLQVALRLLDRLCMLVVERFDDLGVIALDRIDCSLVRRDGRCELILNSSDRGLEVVNSSLLSLKLGGMSLMEQDERDGSVRCSAQEDLGQADPYLAESRLSRCRRSLMLGPKAIQPILESASSLFLPCALVELARGRSFGKSGIVCNALLKHRFGVIGGYLRLKRKDGVLVLFEHCGDLVLMRLLGRSELVADVWKSRLDFLELAGKAGSFLLSDARALCVLVLEFQDG